MILKTHKNTLTAYGTIFGGDGRYFVEEFSRLEQNFSEIIVHLHTPGGSVFDGNLIYNALSKSACDIHIIIDGIAASMGAIIILSAKKVSIVENGYIMIHAPSSYADGRAQDFENQAKLLRSIEKNFLIKLSQRTQKPLKEVEKWLVGDHWFDAQEAQKLGFVSDIIPAQTPTLVSVENPSVMGSQQVYNAYASLFAGVEKSKKIKNKNTMKEILISQLLLEGVTAESSDTAVIEAIKEKIAQEQQATQKAQQELKSFKKEQTDALIEEAIKANKITENQKEVYQKIADTSGIEALQVVLSNLALASEKSTSPNISQIIKGKNTDKKTAWSFQEWQQNDPKGLEKMSVENPEQFQQLFKEQYT